MEERKDIGEDRTLGIDNRPLSRRRVLAATGAAIVSVALESALISPEKGVASLESSEVDESRANTAESDQSAEISEVVVSSLRQAASNGSLHLPLGVGMATIGIDLTDPRRGLALEVTKEEGARTADRAVVTPTSSVVLSTQVAHDLLRGQITPAYALGNGQLVLSGNREELGVVHDLYNLTMPIYQRNMKSARLQVRDDANSKAVW